MRRRVHVPAKGGRGIGVDLEICLFTIRETSLFSKSPNKVLANISGCTVVDHR